ncbi:MAG: alpha-glucan family phosphorylase [Chloroflexi bacterium]|nr:alpha-glucan family phosphorylase [Chloroflexota bacterium]
MKSLGTLLVFPTVPERIRLLEDLSMDLWWSWHPEAQELFEWLDPGLWAHTHHNPVLLLREVDQKRLEAAATDPAFLARYDRVIDHYQRYRTTTDTWTDQAHPELSERKIAYFAAEFGLHECLAIYSGGLGILSGDHCKSASDLGLPLVGVGFFYRQGYFRQRIGPSGTQEAHYEPLSPEALPIRPALDAAGRPATIEVELPGRRVLGRVWHAQVGRVSLYLLDTDMDGNRPEDRSMSARLYGGNAEVRLTQEIVLGIGGVRALRKLGIYPSVWHMNEGHAAFLVLERIREYVLAGLTFAEAREVVAASSVFTTHTPVPAGNDAFHFDLIDRYFASFWPQLGIDRDQFVNLASQDVPWGQAFSMTLLALRLSSGRNGVSALHGQVTRRMWSFMWPEISPDEVPIGHVTNGVHTMTWLGPEMATLYDRHFVAGWRDTVDDPAVWEAVNQIPDSDLFAARRTAKARMIHYIRERIQQDRRRHGESPSRVDAAASLFDPDALTIGFARRFATYKRATLIFRDPERLRALLNRPGHPVQIIFAGKAHPADEPGKALIQRICQLANEPGFVGRIIFIEDYDIELAQHLVQGCDLWLNNPLRPLEASGTSGQKASLNGVPNLSVLDGWWPEAYDGTNGFVIGKDGDERDYDSQEARDLADSGTLYHLLENEIIPLYFDRPSGPEGAGLPARWLRVIRRAICTVAPVFNTHRMVKEYVNRYYVPALARGEALSADDFVRVRQLVAWKQAILQEWSGVSAKARVAVDSTSVGRTVPVEARVYLNGIKPADVRVEVVLARHSGDRLEQLGAVTLELAGRDERDGTYTYCGPFVPQRSGVIEYGVRVLPVHPDLGHKLDLGIARWADPSGV